MHLSLTASGPDVLQQTIALRQSVQGVVALAHSSYEAAKSVHLALSGESAVLVNLADRDLDGSVVLGLDDAVCGAALSWDVTVKMNCQFLRDFDQSAVAVSFSQTYRSTSSPLSFSMFAVVGW